MGYRVVADNCSNTRRALSGTCQQVRVVADEVVLLQALEQLQQLVSGHAGPRDAGEAGVVGEVHREHRVHVEAQQLRRMWHEAQVKPLEVTTQQTAECKHSNCGSDAARSTVTAASAARLRRLCTLCVAPAANAFWAA